jgi:YVTN family beta-propeller protein
VLFAAAMMSIGSALLVAQEAPSGTLLVLSKGELTLSAVDPVTLKVLGRAPSGPDPHEVIASSDGRTAYIANYNGGQNIISVVDLVAMKPVRTIDLGALRAPHGLDFAGGKLWFTAEGARAVGSYDPQSSKVETVVETGQNGTHMIHVAPDVRRFVTSNLGSATMTIAERGASDWNQTVIPVGRGAEGFDVSPDGKEIWVANAQDGTISVIDASAKKVTRTLNANVGGANRLKFTPDGRLVLVSTLRGPDLTILDGATKKEVKRLKTGNGAAGIQMQPDGARAYVACMPDNYVAVIDLKTLEVVGKIDAGRQPDGLAWRR